MNPAWIFVAAILIALLWLIGTHNGLVRMRNHVRESWSDVDTELKRRHDLVPNLVRAVKGHARHEQEAITRVVEARGRALTARTSPHSASREEDALGGSLRALFAVAEAYPDLRADTNFLSLQRELANTEDRIQAARLFYNADVRELNDRVEAVPSSAVAALFGFERAEFFELDSPAEREAARVSI